MYIIKSETLQKMNIFFQMRRRLGVIRLYTLCHTKSLQEANLHWEGSDVYFF